MGDDLMKHLRNKTPCCFLKTLRTWQVSEAEAIITGERSPQMFTIHFYYQYYKKLARKIVIYLRKYISCLSELYGFQ